MNEYGYMSFQLIKILAKKRKRGLILYKRTKLNVFQRIISRIFFIFLLANNF